MTNPNDAADGMTKREYFAAMAMQGLLAQISFIYKDRAKEFYKKQTIIARNAVALADDLIQELNVDIEAEVCNWIKLEELDREKWNNAFNRTA